MQTQTRFSSKRIYRVEYIKQSVLGNPRESATLYQSRTIVRETNAAPSHGI